VVPAAAQTASTRQVGFTLGKLLPGGPEGITEIMGVWGFRYSTHRTPIFAYEMGFIGGAENRVNWQDFFVNMRRDIPLQGLSPHVGIGLDIIRFKTQLPYIDDDLGPIEDDNGNQIYRERKRTALGAHLLGGVQAPLAGPIVFRTDMKLNVMPALILTILASVEYRFGGSESATGVGAGPPKAGGAAPPPPPPKP